jgi:hypothetical protein
MPVLIEGVSVLLRKGSIHERYKGGYAQFLFDLNDYVSFTASNQLLCVSYKTHIEARGLLKILADNGMRVALINEEDSSKTDAVLVDQVFGPSVRVWWIDLIPISRSRKIKAELKDESKALSKEKLKGELKEEPKELSQENILIAATYEETDEKEELRIKNWDQGEIAYPLDWKYENSKSLDLEFLRMAENRSYLNH